MDIGKQLAYWIDGATSDLETAELLIKNRRLLHGLFFCHLSMEKILKAFVVKTTLGLPPKTHNLLRLYEIAQLSLADYEIKLLEILMVYQLEGRYPEYYPNLPHFSFANDILTRTKKILQCLKEKL
jgi:HEPN domain-containing protein